MELDYDELKDVITMGISDTTDQLVVIGDQMERLCTLIEKLNSELYMIGSVR